MLMVNTMAITAVAAALEVWGQDPVTLLGRE